LEKLFYKAVVMAAEKVEEANEGISKSREEGACPNRERCLIGRHLQDTCLIKMRVLSHQNHNTPNTFDVQSISFEIWDEPMSKKQK
jgi:hypothetical protein